MMRLCVLQTNANNMTEEEFYNSGAWKSKRKYILKKRDKLLCQNCKKYGRYRTATTVHHIKHLLDAPELALTDSNLISLCSACHNQMHPEKGGRRR